MLFSYTSKTSSKSWLSLNLLFPWLHLARDPWFFCKRGTVPKQALCFSTFHSHLEIFSRGKSHKFRPSFGNSLLQVSNSHLGSSSCGMPIMNNYFLLWLTLFAKQTMQLCRWISDSSLIFSQSGSSLRASASKYSLIIK